jgi:hypothetical protein
MAATANTWRVPGRNIGSSEQLGAGKLVISEAETYTSLDVSAVAVEPSVVA